MYSDLYLDTILVLNGYTYRDHDEMILVYYDNNVHGQTSKGQIVYHI